MYEKSPAIYDGLYSANDYDADVRYVVEVDRQHRRSSGSDLLDVASGTGLVASKLQAHYKVEGLDLSPEMLRVARELYPSIPFHLGNMADFDLGRQFDVLTCFGSSIGYAKTLDQLKGIVGNFARHLKPGGLLMFVPWILPEDFTPGYIGFRIVEQPDLKIAMMSVVDLRDGVCVFDMHHLVGTPQGVEHFIEHHELGLHSEDDYRAAIAAAGLELISFDRKVIARGMYVARKGELWRGLWASSSSTT